MRRGQLPVNVPISKIGNALDDLRDLIGVNWVQSKVHKYQRWREENSLDDAQFLFHREPEHNPLLPYFALHDDWLKQESPYNWPTERARALRDLAALAASVFTFESFWRTVPQNQARKHITKSLQGSESCRGMLAELLTLTHFVQAGASEVVPRFMDPRPSQDKSDILVTWGGHEIEVHCKSKIPGAGYLVPFDVFDYWAGCFLRDAEFYDRSWYVKLEVWGRMGSHKAREIRRRLQQWLANSLVFDRYGVDEDITVTSRGMEIPHDGLTRQKVSQLARRPMYRAFAAWKGATDGRYHALSVFDMSLNRKPHPVRALSASLREAKKQATGNRPAIASIHVFDDWNLDDLLLPQASGFQRWLLGSLGDEAGRNISAVVLTCEPRHVPMSGMAGVKQYPALWVSNPQAQQPLSPGLLPDKARSA